VSNDFNFGTWLAAAVAVELFADGALDTASVAGASCYCSMHASCYCS
jgi:hypothetical protein